MSVECLWSLRKLYIFPGGREWGWRWNLVFLTKITRTELLDDRCTYLQLQIFEPDFEDKVISEPV
jgi:hypothetical protein